MCDGTGYKDAYGFCMDPCDHVVSIAEKRKELVGMNKQEIFDIVSVHLILPNAKSENDSVCLYRGPNGLKCAAGALLPDEYYRTDMEERALLDVVRKFNVPEYWRTEWPFLEELQALHDEFTVEEWPDVLRSTARTYDLNTDALEKVIQRIANVLHPL